MPNTSRVRGKNSSLIDPCRVYSRKTRRLRRRSTQITLLTSSLQHTAKQFLTTTILVTSRQSATTDSGHRPHSPRHSNIPNLPNSLPQPACNPHLITTVSTRQRGHTNKRTACSSHDTDSTSPYRPRPNSVPSQQRQYVRAPRCTDARTGLAQSR